jgi:1-acyl-sn-glycerol-3-phosphate acyltransferase
LLARNTALFSRLVLWLLGVRVRVKHRERLHEGARLIAANHVSYLDILVIAAACPAVFVTSVELGRTPLLGLLARLGGSLFVERRKAWGLKKEIALVARVLGEGLPVVLFAEGTTSNGERVRPFKNSLFEAAIAAGADVLPLCLRYTRINGEAVSPHNRDSVFYYGGASFFRHFPRLLSLRSVDVDLEPQKLLRPGTKASRKGLASKAHEAVSAACHPGIPGNP